VLPLTVNKVAYLPLKKFEEMFTRFDTIHERDRRTDGRTDTARRRSIARQLLQLLTNLVRSL